MATYHAFPCGKMNQSFRMENESNEILYEANMVAFKLLGAVDYEFINHVTSEKSSHKVSKTKTFEQSSMGFKKKRGNSPSFMWEMKA